MTIEIGETEPDDADHGVLVKTIKEDAEVVGLEVYWNSAPTVNPTRAAARKKSNKEIGLEQVTAYARAIERRRMEDCE